MISERLNGRAPREVCPAALNQPPSPLSEPDRRRP